MKHLVCALAFGLLVACGGEPPTVTEATDAVVDAVTESPTVSESDVVVDHTTVPAEPQALTMPMWDALPERGEDGFRHVEWMHLMPPNFNFELAMSNLEDAPVVEELNGEPIRIPGYVLPLDTDMDRVYRFLIVPYVGACVHVPPPPSNQIIYAQSEEGMDAAELWEAVYIYGTVNTSRVDTEWGASGYVLDVDRWEPYTW